MVLRRISAALLAVALASGCAAATARADSPTQVGAGYNHSCALLAPQGRIACWGDGANGELGDGTATASRTPVAVSRLVGATGVSVGAGHTCAVLGSGSVACWGFAKSVSLYSPSVLPQTVPGVAGAIAVSAGASHACALIAGGRVECWGLGDGGELGDGAKRDSRSAVAVSGIGSAVAVSAGWGSSCAVLAGGGVECWGAGRQGQLGDGGSADSPTPVTVTGIATAVSVSVGLDHACALLAGGGLACWGVGDHGQLGDGRSVGSATPVAVSGVADAVAVSAGALHTCAVRAGGAVACWGYGGDGELGTALRSSSATPVANGVVGATAVSAGYQHTCAVLASATVQCWGAGDAGQLGDGRGRSSATPVAVSGLALPAPVLGQSTTLQPVSGTVRVQLPGTSAFVALSAAATLPLGTTVDTTSGRIRLTSAVDGDGRTQAGLFYDGVFRTGQTAALTVLTLAGALPSGCAASAGATAAAKKKKRKPKTRSLWGDAQGDFQTAGRYAAATVQGTKWLVEDSCAGTRVSVDRGRVRVEDLVRHTTTIVSAGHSLQVGARGGGSGAPAKTTRSFASGVERLLTQLASGRRRLATALSGAVSCHTSLHAAGQQIQAVIANRSAIRAALAGLGKPTAQAATVLARLRAAVDASIAADGHYRDWLSGLEAARAGCPLPHTAAFAAAGRDDARATTAKQRFLAAFNPLARRQHLRTWSASQL